MMKMNQYMRLFFISLDSLRWNVIYIERKRKKKTFMEKFKVSSVW